MMLSGKRSTLSRGAPDRQSFLKNLQNTAHRFSLWKAGDSMIAAVSGGPDSLCLLDCLVALGKKYDWKLHIAHVNYSLRGEESDLDEQLVRERAGFYALPVTVLHPDMSDCAGNLEARLRDVRYNFFETIRAQLGFDTIAVAHNRDDQAETVLLRLLRGSGLRGLGAMRPRAGVIIRPLLLTSREDILRYLEENALPFRIDGSNTDPKFTRNRVRHELLPVLETLNPNIRDTLARSALSLADDIDLLERCIDGTHSVIENADGSGFSLLVTNFLALSNASQRSTLRALIERFSDSTLPPSFSTIEEMRNFIASTKNKVAEKSFCGLKFMRRGARVSVLREK